MLIIGHRMPPLSLVWKVTDLVPYRAQPRMSLSSSDTDHGITKQRLSTKPVVTHCAFAWQSGVPPFKLGIAGLASAQADGFDIGLDQMVPGNQVATSGWRQGGVIQLVEDLILALLQ